MQLPHDARLLEELFADCFARSEQTLLCGGAAEPWYQPRSHPDEPHRLWYREDFFASALHETAHWCIAGRERRLLPDFGYWYAPEGRDPAQQAAFEQVEVRPQALEWCFARACGYRFRVSTDNLAAERDGRDDHSDFQQAVCAQAQHFAGTGLRPRALRFFLALQRAFGLDFPLSGMQFSPQDLQC
ncbi:elongation factor P hydroxylase [Kineobactrum salinum]|uniref:Elongation factor P hydroxylase n=1 Tax=Kineobactrum salinum TaxID=2708301 RepID=A0A6C0TX19_9GAMM|nr:elongation factor P hydroxylase [Kineobactrum salinum]QIB64372.1 elongation factor P hydroxylase [Kineobactrum salinum]